MAYLIYISILKHIYIKEVYYGVSDIYQYTESIYIYQGSVLWRIWYVSVCWKCVNPYWILLILHYWRHTTKLFNLSKAYRLMRKVLIYGTFGYTLNMASTRSLCILQNKWLKGAAKQHKFIVNVLWRHCFQNTFLPWRLMHRIFLSCVYFDLSHVENIMIRKFFKRLLLSTQFFSDFRLGI